MWRTVLAMWRTVSWGMRTLAGWRQAKTMAAATSEGSIMGELRMKSSVRP